MPTSLECNGIRCWSVLVEHMDIYRSLSNENPQALNLTRIDMFTKEEGGTPQVFWQLSMKEHPCVQFVLMPHWSTFTTLHNSCRLLLHKLEAARVVSGAATFCSDRPQWPRSFCTPRSDESAGSYGPQANSLFSH